MVMVKIFNKLTNIAPFILLFCSGLLAWNSHTGWYEVAYQYLGDTIGYSLLTNLVFLKLFSKKAYCNPTRLAVYGLIVMNIVSLFVRSGLVQSRYWYDLVITGIVVIVALIGVIKRW